MTDKAEETQNTWLGAILIICFGAWLFWPGSDATPSVSQKHEWYQGGTLHGASLGKWHAATYENKLATAADWTTGAIGEAEFERIGLNGVRALAEDLITCIDRSTQGMTELYDQKAPELAALCVTLMEW